MVTNSDHTVSDAQASALRDLYDLAAKHGSYHPPPAFLGAYLKDVDLVPNWRDPRPRVRLLEAYIRTLPQADGGGVTFVELGSNTGGQIVELAQCFPQHSFIGLEVNRNHVEFTREVARIMGLENVEVLEGSFSPKEVVATWPDSVFFDFNVAHHIGVDFEFGQVTDPSSWLDSGLIEWLRPVGSFSEYWFSVGYRFGGKKDREIHSPQDPEGFIDVVKKRLPNSEALDIQIFFAEESPSGIQFLPLREYELGELNRDRRERMRRGEFVGEYFARPIFRFAKSGE